MTCPICGTPDILSGGEFDEMRYEPGCNCDDSDLLSLFALEECVA